MHAKQYGATHTLIRPDSNIEDQIRGKWASLKRKVLHLYHTTNTYRTTQMTIETEINKETHASIPYTNHPRQ